VVPALQTFFIGGASSNNPMPEAEAPVDTE
jgi:hypothetical protein